MLASITTLFFPPPPRRRFSRGVRPHVALKTTWLESASAAPGTGALAFAADST